MSDQAAIAKASPAKDENQNKETPTKRTPSKRKSHIERIQEESKELLKTMGVEELSDTRSTRRTRSSTKGSTPAPVTPPTPKATTPSSSRRGKKKALDVDPEVTALENETEEKVSTKQPPPPRKRQKLADTIDEQNLEEVDGSKTETKTDETDAPSREANGSLEKMDVDEVVSTSEKEEKQVIETIPEESSQEVQVEEAKSSETESKEVEKPVEESAKTEETQVVKETSESVITPQEVETMEVDSVKPATEPLTNVIEAKESPPAIVISEAESEVATPVVEEPKESAEPEITSSSEKSEPEVILEAPALDEKKEASVSAAAVTSENHIEPTQVFEISSENASQTVESDSPVVDEASIKSLPTEKTEHSKIEATQDEPISAPIETETPQ